MPETPSQEPNAQPPLNVERDQVHLIVTIIELDIIVDALRSVGNHELASRFETILQQLSQTRYPPKP